MFKYNIGQTVWYMFENKIATAPIGARTIQEVDPEFQKTRAGSNWNLKLLYATIHGNWREEQLFGSLKELSQFLDENTIYGSMTGAK